jgi:beta-glucosidase
MSIDHERSAEDRAAALLGELTLDQKLAQVSCYFPVDVTATDDFAAGFPSGVGQVSCLEARSADTIEEVAEFQRRVQTAAMRASGHGIPAIFHMEGLCGAFLPSATSFPSGLARGSGWNPELERAIGAVVGRQERAVGISHTFAPVLDISRDSRMGRQGETYGEDSTLAAALGAAFVDGLQHRGGMGIRSEAVAKHFLGFHHSEGGIHGAHGDVPDRLLIEVYGKPFQAAITLSGLRGIMPCYNSIGGEPVSASHRLLTGLLRDDMGFNGITVSDYGAISNLHTVQRVAESFAHAGLASLDAGMDMELHLPVGINAELRDWFADGRADVAILDRAVLRVLTTKFRMGLFESPFALDGPQLSAPFREPDAGGVSLQSARESIVLLLNDGTLPLAPGIGTLAVIGCHAVNARYFFGGYTHLSMAEGKLAARASMAGLATASDSTAGVRTIPGTGIQDDADPVFDELLATMYPGTPTLLDELRRRLPGTTVVWARGYPIAGSDRSGHAQAVALAERADVVLMTLGGKHGTSSVASMGEGIDATDINLPMCQASLITTLAAMGKPIVGVHLDGRPVSSDEADTHLSALVEAWSPAEHGAQAIVDVLTGDQNPSGRLPVSVARSAGQISVYYNHPPGSSWHQGESIGFANYVDAPHTPRYHFGHGLSYTTFDYTDLSISSPAITANEVLGVRVTVRNSGGRTGTETVQLYARDRYASMSRPVLELVGFRRVDLEPGRETTVRFQFRPSQLAFLDRDMRWLVEEGDVDIFAGASSDDLRLTSTTRVTGTVHIDGRTRPFIAPSTIDPT